jgi:hypothetical protein
MVSAGWLDWAGTLPASPRMIKILLSLKNPLPKDMTDKWGLV